MAFLSSLNIGGSALTAQRFRMDVLAQNIANAQTSGAENGPYIRKRVILRERGNAADFAALLRGNRTTGGVGLGVEIGAVTEEEGKFKLVYDPDHPDAGADGNVRLPDIDMVKEMMDLMAASQSYKANVTAINTVKAMASAALQIGR